MKPHSVAAVTMPVSIWIGVLLICCSTWIVEGVKAFDITRNDNLAGYWGQDSAGNQQNLSYYCQDDTYDIIPMAFLDVFFGPGGEPELDLANICSTVSDPSYPGTALPNCTFMASDIELCQSKGKIVTLSLGGATGAVGFSNASQAEDFAELIWEQFLGGESKIRPFGGAVLDGVDLDIEGGSSSFYANFIIKLRSLWSGANKNYYVTGAPQCPFPDANLGPVLNAAPFDAVFIQFYNNFCGLNDPQSFDFSAWDTWARTQSPNPNVKLYIGAPGAKSAAGTGYVDVQSISEFAVAAQMNYSTFGGVMLWDVSQAYSNDRYDAAIKHALTTSGVAGSVQNSEGPPGEGAGFGGGGDGIGGNGPQCAFVTWPEDFLFSTNPISKRGMTMIYHEVRRAVTNVFTRFTKGSRQRYTLTLH